MINPKIWLELSRETRLKIAEIINIPRTSIVEVAGNRVVCDGHSAKDLLSITVEKLQEYLQDESTDIYELFAKLVEKVEAPVIEDVPTYEEVKAPEVADVEEESNKVIIEEPTTTENIPEVKVAGPYIDPTKKPEPVVEKKKRRQKKS